MTKLLIIILATTLIGGCVPPPNSLEAERERHAEEIRALEDELERTTEQFIETQQSLEACRADLAGERAHRTDARKALAYLRWCGAIGSMLNLCKDELYNDGLIAYQDGERVDDMRLLALWGWTLLEMAGAVCLVISTPLTLWLQARKKGVLKTREEMEGEKHRLEELRDQYTEWEQKRDRLERELDEIQEAKEYSNNQLYKLYGQIKASLEELEEIKRLRNMLDV